MGPVTLVTLLLCCAMLRVAGQEHPSLLLRGKEPKSSVQRRPFLPFVNVVQPKPLIDDCMELPRRPSGKDLDKKRLFRKIGGESNVDLRYLSYTKPQSDGSDVDTISLRRVSTAMKNHLKEVIRNETKHMPGVQGKPAANVERFMMKWLLHKSFCPVEYTWQDMGPCRWPRWISLGSCVNKQCSWPPGMSCKASNSTDVKMLKWYCSEGGSNKRSTREAKARKRRKNKRRRRCQWIVFKRRVMTHCNCSCEKPTAQESGFRIPDGHT